MHRRTDQHASEGGASGRAPRGGGGRGGVMAMASGLATDTEATAAATVAANRAAEGLSAGLGAAACDVAFVFVSEHHADRLGHVGEVVARVLGAREVVGMAAESVIAGASELEGTPGVAVLGAAMPGVNVHRFDTGDLPLGVGMAQNADEEEEQDILDLAAAVGIGRGHRATLLFADPLTTDLSTMLPALNRARRLVRRQWGPGAEASASALGGVGASGRPSPGPIVGAVASASARPGGNALLVGGRLLRAGLVGLSFSGDLRVDTVVSQGCRGFGPTLIITAAKGNIIQSLGGRPALAVVKSAIDELSEEERRALSRGLMIGVAVDEYKDRFGPGDFLVRPLVNAYQESGAISTSVPVRVGQTARLHLRDPEAAQRDLAMLMDAQALHGPPAGILLISGNGRGSRLFPAPSHDAGAVQRAFADQSWLQAGEQKAKGGAVLVPATLRPLAGCLAAGEVGPVGDSGESFLHAVTACAVMFRPG